MNVEDILARILYCVEHDTVSLFFDPLFVGNVSGFYEDRADYVFFVFGKRVERRVVFLGNNEDVDWGLGIDILEGENFVVLIHNLRRDFFIYNFTKNTVVHSPFPNP